MLLDSGVTDHITPDLNQFISYEVLDTDDTITILDGRKIRALHKGSVALANNIILKDVLHVPNFQFKLISVYKLCKDLNYTLDFNSGSCFLQDPSQKG